MFSLRMKAVMPSSEQALPGRSQPITMSPQDLLRSSWQAHDPTEDHDQQYLAKNPGGCCGIGGCGVACG